MCGCWSATKGRKLKELKSLPSRECLALQKLGFFPAQSICILGAKYYLGLNLCTASDLNSSLLGRETDVLDGVGRRSSSWKGKGKSTLVTFWLFPYNVSGWKCNWLGNFLLRISLRHSGYECLHSILKIAHALFVCISEYAESKPGPPNPTQGWLLYRYVLNVNYFDNFKVMTFMYLWSVSLNRALKLYSSFPRLNLLSLVLIKLIN